MNRWTLAFRDRELEREFQRRWLTATSYVTRAWIIGGIGFYALFTVLLIAFLPSQGQEFIWVRYTIALPVMVLSQIPLYIGERFRPVLGAAYLIGTFAAFGSALFLFIMTHPDHRLVYLLEMLVVFVFCQHYSRVFFTFSVAFSLVGGAAAAAALLLNPKLIDIPVIPGVAAIGALALVGICSGYTREFFVRRNFWSKRVLSGESARNQALAEEAQSASAAKSRFLNIVSHELRTPLNAIIGNADALKAGVFGPIMEPRVRGAVEDISRSSHNLLDTINDVIDLSKSSSSRIEVRETTFSLNRLAAEVVMIFETEAAEREITLQLIDDPELPDFVGDRRLIRRVLVSLVSNALKYTNTGGEVWVYLQPRPSGGVAIKVKDTGIGIAPDKLKKAMEVFAQLDDKLDRQQGGIGIGLPLTKILVEQHGGAIALDSELGRGTKVRVTFPAERVAARKSSDEVRSTAA